jgi:hypothetical protein
MKVKIRKIQKKIVEARENSVQGARYCEIFDYSFGALKLVKRKFLCKVIVITNIEGLKLGKKVFEKF